MMPTQNLILKDLLNYIVGFDLNAQNPFYYIQNRQTKNLNKVQIQFDVFEDSQNMFFPLSFVFFFLESVTTFFVMTLPRISKNYS